MFLFRVVAQPHMDDDPQYRLLSLSRELHGRPWRSAVYDRKPRKGHLFIMDRGISPFFTVQWLLHIGDMNKNNCRKSPRKPKSRTLFPLTFFPGFLIPGFYFLALFLPWLSFMYSDKRTRRFVKRIYEDEVRLRKGIYLKTGR